MQQRLSTTPYGTLQEPVNDLLDDKLIAWRPENDATRGACLAAMAKLAKDESATPTMLEVASLIHTADANLLAHPDVGERVNVPGFDRTAEIYRCLADTIKRLSGSGDDQDSMARKPGLKPTEAMIQFAAALESAIDTPAPKDIGSWCSLNDIDGADVMAALVKALGQDGYSLPADTDPSNLVERLYVTAFARHSQRMAMERTGAILPKLVDVLRKNDLLLPEGTNPGNFIGRLFVAAMVRSARNFTSEEKSESPMIAVDDFIGMSLGQRRSTIRREFFSQDQQARQIVARMFRWRK